MTQSIANPFEHNVNFTKNFQRLGVAGVRRIG
jgi:hypothetical protein